MVAEDMLSSLQLEIKKKLGCKPQGTEKKLIPNFYAKKQYIVHYRNLQFYVSHGMKLVRIHRILQFRQARWMEPYIRFNTEQRKLAKSSEEKNLFKLANNR